MLWQSELEERLPGLCRFNVPLADLNSWGVGGSADCIASPLNHDVIPLLFSLVKKHDLPVWFLGGGTNVLIPDGGIRGVTIYTGFLNGVKQESASGGKVCLVCGAGVLLKDLLRLSLKEGLGGLEFTAGIPGTTGGALIGNAGASGKGIGDLVDWVETIEPDGNMKRWDKKDLSFSYRRSNLDFPGRLILRGCLSLKSEPSERISSNIREQMSNRLRQPHGIGTAGCVFKNPEPLFAGKLLEDCGCKGLSCGRVSVSNQHANFFINRGQAKASDVWELIFKCREKVLRRTGIHLDLEVKLLGESWE